MQILSYFFDLLFPPRPHQELLREIDSLTTNPGRHHDVEYLTFFEDNAVRAAITENKYHNNSKAIRLLANLVDGWLISQNKKIVLIPIPLSKERQRSRGYNQVTEVLKKLNENIVVLDNALIRIKNTETQTSLNKQQRRENLMGAFSVRKNSALSELRDATIVIVDDVVTTGATMEAARAELSPYLPPNCKLKTLAFAH